MAPRSSIAAPSEREELVGLVDGIFLENLFTDQNYPRIEAVRTRDRKYIRYFDRAKNTNYAQDLDASINGEVPIYEELFHLAVNPQERCNLIAESANALRAASLRQELSALVRKYRGSGAPRTIPMAKSGE